MDLGLLLAGLLAIGLWQTRGMTASGPAPVFELRTLATGETVSLQSLKGRPVLLAFWAPWCGVCKVNSGAVSWVRRLVGSRAHVLSVATAYESRAEVERYVAEQSAEYPVLLGHDALVAAYGVKAYPAYYAIDSDGQLKRVAVGYTSTFGLLWRLLL